MVGSPASGSRAQAAGCPPIPDRPLALGDHMALPPLTGGREYCLFSIMGKDLNSPICMTACEGPALRKRCGMEQLGHKAELNAAAASSLMSRRIWPGTETQRDPQRRHVNCVTIISSTRRAPRSMGVYSQVMTASPTLRNNIAARAPRVIYRSCRN